MIKTILLAAAAVSCVWGQSTFHVVPTPNENFNNGLSAISASGPDDIWAVGQSLIHYDGTKWTAFPAPMIVGNNASLLEGVVDFSPTLAWAVGTVGIGGIGSPGQVIEQWNGTTWSEFPGPVFVSGDTPGLSAMTAISPDDMWAVGSMLSEGGLLLNLLFEHWDGTAWTATSQTTNSAFLLGASADATNDVWAVGFNGSENDKSRTLAMHYDGTSWKTVAIPSVGTGANQLNAVVALAPNDVWAVGFSTPVAPPKGAATLTLIEHWDGTSWSVVTSPNVGPANSFQSNKLYGITAVSPTDIWAFGSYFAASGSGHQITLLEHWDGNSWTIQPSPNPTKGGFLSDILMAGVALPGGDLWIVGDEDEAPNDDTLAIHSTTAAPRQ
jgi:hypothetical protein